jgi:type I restriction enzyme S subunit
LCENHLARYFGQQANGSTRYGLSTAAIAKTILRLPRLEEQETIGKILRLLDEAILRTEEVIEKLKRIKAGLLHDLLTRGLDENGELRDPIHHPEQFKDSPLGRIPRGWEIRTLDQVCAKIQDGTHFSPKSTTGPRMYITSKNVRFGYMDLSDVGRISEREHQVIFRRCDVRFGDVLLTKDGASTGNAALNTVEEPFSLLSSVALLRCSEGLLHNEFLLCTILSPGFQKGIQDLMSGNAITRLTLERIKLLTFALPSLEEQYAVAKSTFGIQSRIDQEECYL